MTQRAGTTGEREVPRPWSRGAGWLAWLVVAARWPVVLTWVVVGLAAALQAPALATHGAGLDDITSTDNPALAVEERSARDFGYPLLSRTVLVRADPAGLPQDVVRHAVDRAGEADGPVGAAFP